MEWRNFRNHWRNVGEKWRNIRKEMEKPQENKEKYWRAKWRALKVLLGEWRRENKQKTIKSANQFK